MKHVHTKALCALVSISALAGCDFTKKQPEPALEPQAPAQVVAESPVDAPAKEAAPAPQALHAAPAKAAQPVATHANNIAGGTVIALTRAEDLTNYLKHPYVVVDVFATWCGPCKKLAPELEALARDYGDKVIFVKIDGDQFPNLARQYSNGYPTLTFFKHGVEVHRQHGDSRTVLKDKINKLFGL